MEHGLELVQAINGLLPPHGGHEREHLLKEVVEALHVFLVVVEWIVHPGVVERPPLLVRQHLVGLVYLLEPGLGFLRERRIRTAALDLVRMPPHGEAVVGGAYIGGGRAGVDAEHGIAGLRLRPPPPLPPALPRLFLSTGSASLSLSSPLPLSTLMATENGLRGGVAKEAAGVYKAAEVGKYLARRGEMEEVGRGWTKRGEGS